MKYANPRAELQATPVLSYIRQHFGTQLAFAEHMGVTHKLVYTWVHGGWVVIRDKDGSERLASPKRKIPPRK